MAAAQRQAQCKGRVGEFLIPVGNDLVLADAGCAARAPRHHVGAAVQPAALPALLEKGPDHVIVFVREGEVAAAEIRHAEAAHQLLNSVRHLSSRTLHGHALRRILHQPRGQFTQVIRLVPVHPVPQPNGLFRLHGGETQYPLLAFAHEGIQAVGFDVSLGPETQFLLHLHLDPQSLTVEAVLVAQFPAAHGPEAAEHVLVGTPPPVMHAEWVIGRYRPVQKGPSGLSSAQATQGAKGVGVFP